MVGLDLMPLVLVPVPWDSQCVKSFRQARLFNVPPSTHVQFVRPVPWCGRKGWKASFRAPLISPPFGGAFMRKN